MFKKDTYIVLIKGPFSLYRPSVPLYGKEYNDAHFKVNHIYKQNKDSNYLEPYYDSIGSQANGWACYSYFHKNWRRATKEEIKEYNNKERPCSVLYILNKLLIIIQ